MNLPFGPAQIGKAFRNEIVARQFIFRMREFVRRGATERDVESLLNNLPQVFADQGGSVSNGSSGTALSIGLQNIPEGLIVATALWSIGVHKVISALAALATGLVEPIGAGIGVTLIPEMAVAVAILLVIYALRQRIAGKTTSKYSWK